MEDNLVLRGDFILVKEVEDTGTIGDTELKLKYDDNSHFMVAEIVKVSTELAIEYVKYYSLVNLSHNDRMELLSRYKPGRKVVLQRIAKVPYKDGLYFASFKDILAFVTDEEPKKVSIIPGQLSLFE